MIPLRDRRNFNIDLDVYFEQLITDLSRTNSKKDSNMINDLSNDTIDTIDIDDITTQDEFDFDTSAQQDDADLAGDAVVDAANWYLTHFDKSELLNYIAENV